MGLIWPNLGITWAESGHLNELFTSGIKVGIKLALCGHEMGIKWA